jgi:uncharacterized protein YdeI (YjbR/CyaY-like superfamily)
VCSISESRGMQHLIIPGQSVEITPRFFATPAAFRKWLAGHHDTTRELWVGFHKKATGKPSITWPEAVDQLLCFGWIDGVRKSLDSQSYIIRVTPRKPGSIWSAVNTRRAEELCRQGFMEPAGMSAFNGRDRAKSKLYSFERGRVQLSPAQQKRFRAKRPAWEFFQAQPLGYRKTAIWWVVSAKQETTRQNRLSTLIADSEGGLRIAQLRRSKDAPRT